MRLGNLKTRLALRTVTVGCIPSPTLQPPSGPGPLENAMKKRICASCRSNEGEPIEAEWFVKGRIPTGDRWMPYQAYLCDCHVEVLLDDGAEFTVQRELTNGGRE